MEVKHVLLFEADLWPKVLSNHALPGWVELFVENFLQFFCQVDILDFAGFSTLLEHVFYGFQSHIYSQSISAIFWEFFTFWDVWLLYINPLVCHWWVKRMYFSQFKLQDYLYYNFKMEKVAEVQRAMENEVAEIKRIENGKLSITVDTFFLQSSARLWWTNNLWHQRRMRTKWSWQSLRCWMTMLMSTSW